MSWQLRINNNVPRAQLFHCYCLCVQGGFTTDTHYSPVSVDCHSQQGHSFTDGESVSARVTPTNRQSKDTVFVLICQCIMYKIDLPELALSSR